MSQTLRHVSLLSQHAGLRRKERRGDTYPDELVLGTSGEVLAVGAEADAADVQVAANIDRRILQDAQLLSRLNIVDLSRPVAARGNILAVMTEPNAAHDTFVCQGVDQIDVKHAGDAVVEDGKPVVARLLSRGRQTVGIQIAEGIAYRGTGRRGVRPADASMVRRGVADLGRLGGTREGDRSVNLRGRRSHGAGRPTDTTTSRAGRSRALGGLRPDAVSGRSPRVGLLLLRWGRLLLGRLLGRLLRRLLLLEVLGLRLGRRDRKAGRTLSHLMLRAELLVLLRRGRRGSEAGSLTSAGHYAVEEAVAGGDRGRLLRRAGVRRRPAVHTGRGVAAGDLELAAEMLDLIFVPFRGIVRETGPAQTFSGRSLKVTYLFLRLM
jgi:hypothetical protein